MQCGGGGAVALSKVLLSSERLQLDCNNTHFPPPAYYRISDLLLWQAVMLEEPEECLVGRQVAWYVLYFKRDSRYSYIRLPPPLLLLLLLLLLLQLLPRCKTKQQKARTLGHLLTLKRSIVSCTLHIPLHTGTSDEAQHESAEDSRLLRWQMAATQIFFAPETTADCIRPLLCERGAARLFCQISRLSFLGVQLDHSFSANRVCRQFHCD